MWIDEAEADLAKNIVDRRARRYALLSTHLPRAFRELRAIEVALSKGDDPIKQREAALRHLAGRCSCVR